MSNRNLLCEIGTKIQLSESGHFRTVSFKELENLADKIFRIQFSNPEQLNLLSGTVELIESNPEISLRFYGQYSEDLIDWELLKGVERLFIDLWETKTLERISELTNLKRLGIQKQVKSQVNLNILSKLDQLEYLFTSISKGIENISELKNLKFLSLSEVKTPNLNFLNGLTELDELWISLGSITDFSDLDRLQSLTSLSLHQVRGITSGSLAQLNNKNIKNLELVNLKNLIDLKSIGGFGSLEYLRLEGIKNLESYEPLNKLESLTTISAANSRPLNKSIKGLYHLNNIWLGDSYSKDEINQLLTNSNAQNIWIRGKEIKGNLKHENPFGNGLN